MHAVKETVSLSDDEVFSKELLVTDCEEVFNKNHRTPLSG